MAFQLKAIIDKSRFIITNTEAFSKYSECLCSVFVKLDNIFIELNLNIYDDDWAFCEGSQLKCHLMVCELDNASINNPQIYFEPYGDYFEIQFLRHCISDIAPNSVSFVDYNQYCSIQQTEDSRIGDLNGINQLKSHFDS
ncbi:hypothetical protein Smp_135050 [Schistosoma mansoni]|uniref:hypothetical protein n=1 Tax=Schistosoma mansoni TaxID=6183 RepID=UPI0001A62FF6|nr:hypothetical protein Smp_135050 [Schistosoma mansoni]|eukprot:XP_018650421.1 hypothetical protein Smp_135050 [Schistosoma mansoni]